MCFLASSSGMAYVRGSAARAATAATAARAADAAAHSVARALPAAKMNGRGLFLLGGTGIHPRCAAVAEFGPQLLFKEIDSVPPQWAGCIVQLPRSVSLALGLGRGPIFAIPNSPSPTACRGAGHLGPSANQGLTSSQCNASLACTATGGQLRIFVRLAQDIDTTGGRVQLFVDYGEGTFRTALRAEAKQRLANAAAARARGPIAKRKKVAWKHCRACGGNYLLAASFHHAKRACKR